MEICMHGERRPGQAAAKRPRRPGRCLGEEAFTLIELLLASVLALIVVGGTTVTELTGVESASFTPYSAKGVTLASGAGASIAANPQYPSSIALTLSVKDISQLDTQHTHLVAGVSNPITVQDGVALRNYS